MGQQRRQGHDENVDLIDEHDRVIGVTTRAVMRAERLLHRSVAVVVLSHDGLVLLHQRSDDKDIWPSRWDLAAGGVVHSGETYDDAAQRELGEELGISGAVLEDLGAFLYTDDDVAERCRCFITRYDGPIEYVDGEIVAMEWATMADTEVRIASDPSRFVPDSVALIMPLLRRRFGGG